MVAYFQMEAAKRMVLVDERVLDHLQRKQAFNWRKPTEQVAKSKLNRKMSSDLHDGVPDDVKMKQYNQNLSRFLHTQRSMPIEATTSTSEKEPAQSEKKIARKTSAKRSKKNTIPVVSTRTGRIKRRPKRFAWDDWNES